MTLHVEAHDYLTIDHDDNQERWTGYLIVDENGVDVCEQLTDRALAYQMAAAPLMLMALQAVTREYSVVAKPDDVVLGWCRQAIAKATGEAAS
jgi:hypothetical protein